MVLSDFGPVILVTSFLHYISTYNTDREKKGFGQLDITLCIVQPRTTKSLHFRELESTTGTNICEPIIDFEKPAALRRIFGAGIVGCWIDLSLDLAVDGIRPTSEREQPVGGSFIRTMSGHHAMHERRIPATSITRGCELSRIESPRVPATRDGSRRRAESIHYFDVLPFIRCAPFAVS